MPTSRCSYGSVPRVFASARVNVMRVLGSHGANSAGGRPSPLRRWLVGAQIAGSTVFLVVAALFVQAYSSVATTELGFERDRMVVAELEPALHGYSADATERYIETLMTRLRTLPGVVDVAVADRVPFSIGFQRVTSVWPQGGACAGDTCPKVATYAVGAAYFRTMGIPMREGREFDSRKPGGEVVVNEALARQQWPDGGGIGERLRVGPEGEPLTVIGIAEDMRARILQDEREYWYYIPMAQYILASGGATNPEIFARVSGRAEDYVETLRRRLQREMPGASYISVRALNDLVAPQQRSWEFGAKMFVAFGALALILAAIGLYSVIAYSVAQRTQEMGIRVAHGARVADILALVVRQGALLAIVGAATGIAVAITLAPQVQPLLFQVSARSFGVYTGVSLGMLLVALIASLIPAWRAARVNPMLVLRSD